MKAAIVVLQLALSTALNNAPINEAEGNLEQAALERANAKGYQEALDIIERIDILKTQPVIRLLEDHKVNPANDLLIVSVMDLPGSGGASHIYSVLVPGKDGAPDRVIEIPFQNGPIKEAGVNGVTQEVLLNICADRLRSFQAGPFNCEANAVSLTHVEAALATLKARTQERMARQVEGTHQV